MSYRKKLIQLLDRPGGRFLLGRLATYAVQRDENRDIEIRYIDGLWTRRVGQDFLPDGPRFQYEYSDFGSWRNQIRQYQDDSREFWLRHYTPRPGDTIVDVGAGRGEDTLTFSRGVGPRGRVIAIEAHPLSFDILKSFCRLNRLSNVTALNVAVMDTPGTVFITESASSWQENSIEFGKHSGGVSVQATTLDDICAQYGVRSIDFIKMNIEGAERYALTGMQSTMPKIQQICVACHDFRADLGHGEEFRTRALTEQTLRNGGFALTSRTEDPRHAIRDHVFGLTRKAQV